VAAPRLQGYLAVVLLAEQARYRLFPARGDVIPTGPSFVTRAGGAGARAQPPVDTVRIHAAPSASA